MSYPPQDPNQQPQYAQQHAAPQYAQPQQAYAAPGGTLPAPGPGEPFDGATHPDDLIRPLYGATFGQAIRRFFKNYANFKGRASRSEYWWAQLFIFLLELIPMVLYFIGIGMMIASAAANTTFDENGDPMVSSAAGPGVGGGIAFLVIGGILLLIIGLGVLVPSLAIAWRRLHDSNFAGPFWFLSLTSVGAIIILVFTLLPPKPEGRRFDLPR